MPRRTVFVSYPFNDANHYRGQLVQWSRDGLLGDLRLVHETVDVRANGADAIDQHVRSQMRGCDTLLVLVGDNSHNRPWQDREAEIGISAGMRIVAVRLPSTTGASPQALADRPMVPWGPTQIRRALGT